MRAILLIEHDLSGNRGTLCANAAVPVRIMLYLPAPVVRPLTI
jgi:hypothetical protein